MISDRKVTFCAWIAAAACLFGSGGCFLWTSRSEGDALKRRIGRLEEGLLEERKKLKSQLEEAQVKIEKLEALLARATRLLAEDKTDVELRVQQLEEQSDETRGAVAELSNTLQGVQTTVTSNEQTLERLASKMGVDADLAPDEIPSDRSSHFNAASVAYQAEEYGKARALLKEYLKRYPRDEQADDAQYWLGASYLKEGRPATALGEFRRVLSDYPKSNVMDKVLFDMAEAFWRLHACTDAKSALTALLRQHPRSPLKSQAQQKLRQVRNARKGYCTS